MNCSQQDQPGRVRKCGYGPDFFEGRRAETGSTGPSPPRRGRVYDKIVPPTPRRDGLRRACCAAALLALMVAARAEGAIAAGGVHADPSRGGATAEQATQAPSQNPSPSPSTKTTAGKPSSAKKKKKSAAARRQLEPEPARIREIQEALAKEGYYHGEPTGKWDDASVGAMKDFQAAKGLPATGKLEAHSLQKLGLGSPVAGAAAPEPKAGAETAAPKDKPPR